MLGGRYSYHWVAGGETEVKSRNKNVLRWDLNLWSATADVIPHLNNCPAEGGKDTTLLGWGNLTHFHMSLRTKSTATDVPTPSRSDGCSDVALLSLVKADTAWSPEQNPDEDRGPSQYPFSHQLHHRCLWL